ncbi:MAG TPA: LCP family protein [Gemmatimonadales bacterium]|nr:LCP family protein [Gemmatimonadales bacterium]
MSDRGDVSHSSAEQAAVLSAILPGWGQWRTGRRRRGTLLALPMLGGLGVAVWLAGSVWRSGATGLVELLVRPAWLWALLVGNLVLAAVRVFAATDAWVPLRRPAVSARTWRGRAVALTVTAVMLVPHAVLHVYAWEAIDLIDTVFVDDTVPPLAQREEALLAEGFTETDLGPTTTSTTQAPTTTAPRVTLPPLTDTDLVDPVGTDPDPVSRSELGGRFTVLLAGGDFGPGRNDLRTDVMIVATLDLRAGTAALISVSRELAQVPLPSAWAGFETMQQVQRWHEDRAYEQVVAEAEEAGEEPPPQPEFEYCWCFADRINYLYTITSTWVRTFPDAIDPGMETLRQTLSLLLGIEIDHYVLVDFAGFVDLVDALGGVMVNVTESMDVGFSPAREGEDPVRVTVEPGRHRLDGHQALAYVRNRTGSSDNERMRRQRCMIRGLAAELDPYTLLRHFPSIAAAIRTSTTTTLPLELVPELIEAVGALDSSDIATLAITSPGFGRGANYMNLPIVDPPRVRAAVAELLEGLASGSPPVEAADSECG